MSKSVSETTVATGNFFFKTKIEIGMRVVLNSWKRDIIMIFCDMQTTS